MKKEQVRIVIVRHGREFYHPERAIMFLGDIKEKLEPYGVAANTPNSKNMSIVFNPKK